MPALAADPTIRRRVMSAAREALAEDDGAPVAAIAVRAGVSRATFYRHFGSRSSLLQSMALEPRPPAQERILCAAKDMLVTTSVRDLSMEELAAASSVSRGSLYRIFPGKVALLEALIERYSPFEALGDVVARHGDDPPEVVFPLIGRAVVGVARERLGLMRAMLFEVSSGTGPAVAGIRPLFAATLGALANYLARQMAAGRVRTMDPILALQTIVGPIFFHLLTRPTLERIVGLQMGPEEAVDELVAGALAGLLPRSETT